MGSKNALQGEWQNLGGFYVEINERHRFGTDAILLENFAQARKKDFVCDIGTGCGIIPVLMCKNGRAKKIFAIEIQNEAAKLAENSAVRNSLLKIEVICENAENIKAFDKVIETGSLDLVVCNPPYYKKNSGGSYPESQRKACREEESLSIYGVCEFAKRFLKFGGRLCVCFKPQRLCDCVEAMRSCGIEPKKIRFVYTELKNAPWLVLIDGKKGAKPFADILSPLIMRSPEGEEEIRKIYGDIREKQE